MMEDSWKLMYQELSLCDVRPWIDFLGVMPGDVGVDMFGRHNLDTIRQENRDVFCAYFNWVSGRHECTIVENFLQTYRRYGSVYPEQKYFVQLRTRYTDNIRNEWRKILHGQILPLMEEIRRAGVYSDRGCELIQRAKDLIAPWSIPRPWPPEIVKKKRRRNPINTKRADQISLL
jgi:hypothetical protein